MLNVRMLASKKKLAALMMVPLPIEASLFRRKIVYEIPTDADTKFRAQKFRPAARPGGG
jgi:hypothetical protein